MRSRPSNVDNSVFFIIPISCRSNSYALASRVVILIITVATFVERSPIQVVRLEVGLNLHFPLVTIGEEFFFVV